MAANFLFSASTVALVLAGTSLLTSSCRPFLGSNNLLSSANQLAVPERFQDTYWALELPSGAAATEPGTSDAGAQQANCLYLLHFSSTRQRSVISCPGQSGTTEHDVVANSAQVEVITAFDYSTKQASSYQVEEATILTPTGATVSCPSTSQSAPAIATSIAQLGDDKSKLLVWSRKPSSALVYVKISEETFQKVLDQVDCQP